MPGIPHAEELWTSNTGMTFQLASGNSFVIQVAGQTVATFGAAGPVYPTGSQISYPAGTVAAPSFAFTGDLDTGIYRIGANNLGVAVNGAKVLDVSTTGLGVVGTILNGDGTVALPAFSFTADTDSGLYRVGANSIALGVNGAIVLGVTATGLAVTGTVQNGDGTVALPAFSFAADTDTGVYRIGANNVGVAVNGAKVLDIATTGMTVTGVLATTGQPTFLNATAIPAAGAATAGILFSSVASFGVFFGSNAPTFSAAQGSLYLRSDGSSTSTRAYINTNGTTGWAAITTAS